MLGTWYEQSIFHYTRNFLTAEIVYPKAIQRMVRPVPIPKPEWDGSLYDNILQLDKAWAKKYYETLMEAHLLLPARADTTYFHEPQIDLKEILLA